jgi:two-component system NtrC family sensor kinase
VRHRAIQRGLTFARLFTSNYKKITYAIISKLAYLLLNPSYTFVSKRGSRVMEIGSVSTLINTRNKAMESVSALVVDSEMLDRQMAEHVLNSAGYQVCTGISGEEALSLFGQHTIDLVVTEINLPGIDGIEMIHRIKESDPHIACVVMTGRQDQESAIEAMRSGAVSFLHKPFTSADLEQAAFRAMQVRKRQQRLCQLEKELRDTKRERERFESHIIDTEKLSSLGQLAPRIAHEIKSPLQVIWGHAELAMHWVQQLEGENLERAIESLEKILPAASQIQALVQQMFELGKPLKPSIEEIDLVREVDAILDDLVYLGALKNCEIERYYEKDLAHITGDRPQLDQVFRNLFINASQAMEQLSDRRLRVHLTTGTTDTIDVRISDCGCGIKSDDLAHIFQPFYTTKTNGKGTGLGLAIAHSVVERHGGRIEVHSQPRKGTDFTVILPTHKH